MLVDKHKNNFYNLNKDIESDINAFLTLIKNNDFYTQEQIEEGDLGEYFTFIEPMTGNNVDFQLVGIKNKQLSVVNEDGVIFEVITNTIFFESKLEILEILEKRYESISNI